MSAASWAVRELCTNSDPKSGLRLFVLHGAHAAKKARLWLRLVVVGFSAVLLVRILAPQIDAALTT